MFEKKGPNNIFIIKSQNLKKEGGKNFEGTNQTDEPKFLPSKILQESSKLEHFQFGYKFRGVKILDLSKVQISNNYHISNILDWGKNSLDCLEKKYGNIGCFRVLLEI